MRERVRIKYCRHCGHVIPIDTSRCPYCDELVIRGHEQKECPFCGEVVKAMALKCKHCGEFLDGRTQQGPQAQQILQIEKAIIATGGQGAVQLTRPDGEPVDVAELPPAAQRKLGGGAPPPKALPAGAELEETVGAEGPVSPAETVMAAPPAVRPPPEAPPKPTEKPVKVPPVEMECPACKRTVFHGDHYCENCGRDLRQTPSGGRLKPIARAYAIADYALMLSASAPVGLVLRLPYSLLIGAGGLSLSVWSALKVVRSEGRLKGLKAAVWGAVLGAFWLALIVAAQG